ncbi:proteinrelated to secreted protein- sviceus [Metarhizium robertsii ARSEF 23]|uniref:Proteinrelated to secreted protein-sviceus n=1 Tax=Metarhizium robertsii (strain ARSEF 23 / ATCC MYA-3075) TaxID=655844 RepID=E9EL02_METRA|nr:proteinrelated to secreted protein- sviceus [Metarhizium robertsii ARSEF 23]EFZ04393.1 proteinrelated to secreted protein- sviceus [Metarhizium robertsii ARSEF 23]
MVSTKSFLAFMALSVGLHGYHIQRDLSESTASRTLAETRDTAAEFVHPGIFVDSSQLQRMASKVASKTQTWTAAYDAMMKHPYAAIETPTPYENVECGPYSDPDIGCADERKNALAAYLNALAWATTKDQSKATRAISIMNAWAKKIKRHTNKNAPLQAAWAATVWARAGEIIRYTDAAWSSEDITSFEGMLRNVYLPIVKNGSKNPNNWDLVLMEASISIAVFLNDRATYDASLARFINSTSYYIYLKSDGPEPRGPYKMPRKTLLEHWWEGQKEFNEDGMAMEVCRDLTHTAYGLASISHVAETARIQGRDLYSEDTGTRLRAGLEFQTKYDKKGGAQEVPSWLCKGNLKLHLEDVTEPGYSILGAKDDMPYTKKYTAAARPAGANTLFVGWETLTHATGEL